MEIDIVNQKENKPINRKELEVLVIYPEAPPSRLVVKKEVSKKVNAEDKLVVVKKMANVFGNRKIICNVNVYADEKTLDKYEPKYIIKRNKVEEKSEEKKEETKEEKNEEKEEGKEEEKEEKKKGE